MKITGIQAQVKTRGRYSIFVDGKFAFGLSELGLINSGLKIGTELTEPEFELHKQASATDKIYNMALGLIARRPRSEWEIRDYLQRKGLDRPTTDEILNTLSIRGYVDDEDFARRWTESRRQLKNISARKLSLELKQKRISDEVIRMVLADDQTDELDVLRREVEKKRRLTRYQDKPKLMQYLARQGYRYDDIKTVLNEENT